MKLKLAKSILNAWDKAKNCNCNTLDCNENHKLCGICGDTIIFGAHESKQPNSFYAWNIDHIFPISMGGLNNISNIQVVHIDCNRKKDNRYLVY